jgi:PAS domain S-box-containing protein
MHQALGPSQIALITKPDVICHGCPLSRIYQDKGVITLPLIYEKQTLGVLSVSLPASFLFDQQEITLLKEIAADLAYAMETIQQEQQVQAQEIKYREIFDNVNDAIFLHRVLQEGTSQFVEVNQLACDRLGYSKEELLELSPKDINTPEGLNKIPEVINILKQGKKHTFTTEHLAKDGKRIPVEISSKLFELEGQTLILSVARDLSQRTKPD